MIEWAEALFTKGGNDRDLHSPVFFTGLVLDLGYKVHGIASLLFFEKHPWSSYICVDMANGRVRSGSGRFWSIGLRVVSGWPIFFPWIFFFYKENNMYLPFGKLCNKLLDVKCIILNLPLILRMNSVKLINTYSIILKLYKS